MTKNELSSRVECSWPWMNGAFWCRVLWSLTVLAHRCPLLLLHVPSAMQAELSPMGSLGVPTGPQLADGMSSQELIDRKVSDAQAATTPACLLLPMLPLLLLQYTVFGLPLLQLSLSGLLLLQCMPQIPSKPTTHMHCQTCSCQAICCSKSVRKRFLTLLLRLVAGQLQISQCTCVCWLTGRQDLPSLQSLHVTACKDTAC